MNGAHVPDNGLDLDLSDSSCVFEHQAQLPVYNSNIGKLVLVQDKAALKEADLDELDADDQLLLIEGVDRLTKEKSLDYDELAR